MLCSHGSDAQYNCIDPHIAVDPRDGKVWMNWGSDADGIFIAQLIGHPTFNRTVGPYINIAQVPGRDPVVEASWIQSHVHDEGQAAVCWLFVNWGQCCDGVNSTYQVRYGKSSNISGPYVDAAGVDMAAGGGSVLLATHQDGRDRQVGPGQVGFPSGPRGGGGPNANHSAPVISYHFYDRYGEPVERGRWAKASCCGAMATASGRACNKGCQHSLQYTRALNFALFTCLNRLTSNEITRARRAAMAGYGALFARAQQPLFTLVDGRLYFGCSCRNGRAE